MKNKSDDKQIATKKDIKGLRAEFKKVERALRQEILRVEEKVEGVEERVGKTEENLKETIRNSTNDLMTKIDSFAGRTETLEEENTVGADQIRELKERADDHETRITELESMGSH